MRILNEVFQKVKDANESVKDAVETAPLELDTSMITDLTLGDRVKLLEEEVKKLKAQLNPSTCSKNENDITIIADDDRVYFSLEYVDGVCIDYYDIIKSHTVREKIREYLCDNVFNIFDHLPREWFLGHTLNEMLRQTANAFSTLTIDYSGSYSHTAKIRYKCTMVVKEPNTGEEGDLIVIVTLYGKESGKYKRYTENNTLELVKIYNFSNPEIEVKEW